MHLRPRRPDAFDQPDHPVEIPVGIRIDHVRRRVGRPIGMDEHLGPRPRAPDFFRDEGHDRVQQDQALIQRPGIGRPRLGLCRRVFAVEDGLGEFQIPVAERVPDETIKRLCRIVEAEGFHRLVHRLARLGDLALYPAVEGKCHLGRAIRMGHVEDAPEVAITCRIPELRAEVAVALDPLHVELQHPAERGHRRIGEAQRVGTVFVDDLERVDHIAERLGHLLALGVAHQPVQIDCAEGHLTHDRQLHHHHPRDPEEQDVLPGHKDRGREIALQFRGVVGPSQCADGPEPGGEPGVEDIRIPPDRIDQIGRILTERIGGEAFGQFFRGGVATFHLDHAGMVQRCRQARQNIGELPFNGGEIGGAMMHLVPPQKRLARQQAHDLDGVEGVVAFVVREPMRGQIKPVPHRDLMPPPELARDAPGLDVLEPVVIGLLPALGQDADGAALHGVKRRAHDAGGVDEPLVGQHRLDHPLRPVAMRLHDRLGRDQWDLCLRAFGIGLQSRLAQPRIVGAGHDGEALGGDLLDDAGTRLEPVEAAQVVGHEVQCIGLGLGQCAFPARDRERDFSGLGIRCAVVAHVCARVHQAIAGNAAAAGHAIVVEVMRPGDLDRARPEIRVGILVHDDGDKSAMLLRAHRDLA